jgi:hypothetical protein
MMPETCRTPNADQGDVKIAVSQSVRFHESPAAGLNPNPDETFRLRNRVLRLTELEFSRCLKAERSKHPSDEPWQWPPHLRFPPDQSRTGASGYGL